MKLVKGDFIDDLDRWIADYFDILTTYSDNINTKDNYERALNHFREYCLGYQDDYSLDKLNQRFFIGFLSYLKKEMKHSSSTINTYLIVVKIFFNYISINNSDEIDYSKILKEVKPIKDKESKNKKVKYFKDEDRKKIENYIEKKIVGTMYKDPSFFAVRNYILIKLLLYTGIRVSELIGIKLSDLKTNPKRPNQYKIKILGKGDYIRTVNIRKEIIDKKALKIFKEHLEQYNIDIDYIAITKTGKRLNRIRVWEITTALAKRLFITVGNPHSYRHSLGSMLVTKEKISSSVGAKVLGHKDTRTFDKFYVHVDEEDVEDIADLL